MSAPPLPSLDDLDPAVLATYGPPLPPTVAELASRPTSGADFRRACADLGLPVAPAATDTREDPLLAAMASFVAACEREGLRVFHFDGQDYPPAALAEELAANLTWARDVADDFNVAWTDLDERRRARGCIPLLVTAQQLGLKGAQQYSARLRAVATADPVEPKRLSLPSLAFLGRVRQLEVTCLCPGLFTGRLRWLLLQERPWLRLRRDAQGHPVELGPLLVVLRQERGLGLLALTRAAVQRLGPTVGPPRNLARKLWAYSSGLVWPRRSDRPLFVVLDDLLGARGKVLRVFDAIERTDQQRAADRDPLPPGPTFDAHFADVVRAKSPDDDFRLAHGIEIAASAIWRKPSSAAIYRNFVGSLARSLLLSPDDGGLGRPPAEASVMRFAMFPEEYFFPADDARLIRRDKAGPAVKGKTPRDGTSQACYKLFRSLLRDRGLYDRLGSHYYADPSIAALLPTHQLDPLLPEVPGAALITLEARWQEQRSRAQRTLDQWRHTWFEAKDGLGSGGRLRALLMQEAEQALAIVRALVAEAWTALPPKSHAIARAIWIRDLTMIEFLLRKGVRRGLLRTLLVAEFQLRPDGIWRAVVSGERQKNERQWFGDLVEPLAKALHYYLAEGRPVLRAKGVAQGVSDEGRLFLSNAGGPLDTDRGTYRNVLRRTRLIFGLALNPHAFRHLLATALIAAGADPEDVADLLLIEVATVREHYAKFAPMLAFRRQGQMLATVIAAQGLQIGPALPQEEAAAG